MLIPHIITGTRRNPITYTPYRHETKPNYLYPIQARDETQLLIPHIGTRRNPDAFTVGDSDDDEIDPRACDRRPVRRRCVHMAEFYDEVRHNNTWPQQQHLHNNT